MSPLKDVLDTLSSTRSKLFNGVYSMLDYDYEDDEDELQTAITGIEGNTQHIFNISIIRSQGVTSFKSNNYVVEIRYFKVMKAKYNIPARQLLDFLLHARIVVNPNGDGMSFDYTPSL